MGGAIGSFVNVVVYRLPAGLSLIRPGSHCPLCKHPIRWHDNVPVFGWIALRGKCRDCRSPISVRYPLVEAISAAVFLGLGVGEFFLRGASLPLRPEILFGEVFRARLDMVQLAGILAYHLLFFSTLLAALLIDYDGRRVPGWLWLPAMAVGASAPLAWPWLHPVPAALLPADWIAGLADVAAGAGAGAVLGWLARPVVGRRSAAGFFLALVGTGLFLGWQSVAVLAVGSVALGGLSAVVGFRSARATFWLGMAALGWVLAWSPLVTNGIGRLWIGRW
jgi:leader peptidase (prepilin peptidase)/N-methyltransferase